MPFHKGSVNILGWFSKAKSFVKNNVSSVVHGVLDVAGFIPVVGAVADLANAAIYAVEGDYGNALLSAAAAIPGAGDAIALASKGTKVITKGAKVVKGAKALSKAKKGSKVLSKAKKGLKVLKGKAKIGAKSVKKGKKPIFKSIKKKIKKKITKKKCFTGDTLVHTEKGLVPICLIEKGDLVYSRKKDNNVIAVKKVISRSESAAHTLYEIEINNTSLVSTTAYHSFYLEEKGWVNAIHLCVGDKLSAANGLASITAIKKRIYEEPIVVYNLQVEEWESYFVTDLEIYVHNGKSCVPKKKKPKKSTKSKPKKNRCGKGEPVDAVTGIVFYETVDFEVPGLIPIVWERVYFSDSVRNGRLGYGTYCSYESEILVSESDNTITLWLLDGRALILEPNTIDEPLYNRYEKLTLYKRREEYEVLYHEERLSYKYKAVKKQANKFSLVEIRNEANHKILLNYDNENLIQIIDTVGRKINISNDNQNRMKEISLHDKKLVSYEYNENGDLARIKDAIGQKILIEYKNHLISKMTNKEGYSFYWEYDGVLNNSKCIHTWGDNGLLEYYFDYKDGYNYSTNGFGYTETFFYNSSNLITKVINARGNISEFEYNDYEEVITIIDALKQKTMFEYDELGNLIEQREPSGATTKYLYDDKSRVVSVEFPNGGKMVCDYDEYGNIKSIINPDNSETKYIYNSNNLIEEIEDSLGNKSKFSYDKWGNIVEVNQADNSKYHYEYDGYGNCTSVIDPVGVVQRFKYDELNRNVKIDMPDGNVIQLKYNAYDEVVIAEDKQKMVFFEYTWSGKMKMRKELDRLLKYSYDSEEQLISIENEKGDNYYFKYDGNGNLIEEVDFEGICYKYHYDKLDQLIKIVQPDEKVKNFELNTDGEITQIEYNDGSKEIFKYNNMGSLVEVENSSSKIKLELDIMDRVTKVIQDDYIIEYEYDMLGQKIGVTSSLGAVIKQEYDISGNISKINAMNKSSQSWVSEMNYNTQGYESSKYLPKGLKSVWEFDKIGRPSRQYITDRTEIKHARKYSWDMNDQLKSITYDRTKITYTYDSFGNLEGSRHNDKNIVRSLDSTGNIYGTIEHIDREYDKGGRLIKDNNVEYEYDKIGNLIKRVTSDGTWKYNYYDNNLMSKVICPDGKETTFKYDGFGRRIEKCYDGIIKKYLWDGNVMLHEWEVDNNLSKELNTWIFEETNFTPLAKITDEKSFSIISDHLGTPIAMFDGSGERIWSGDLDIYGKVENQEGDYNACLFRYAGQYEDEETGLYYNRFRYYSPETGMFTQQDPIGFDSGIYNFYQYVSNPNTIVDPFGLDWVYNVVDKKGKVTYTGRVGPNVSMKDVAKRHSKTVGTNGKPRFMKGDTLIRRTPKSTDYDIVRGLEQLGIDQEKTMVGRSKVNRRNNNIEGISKSKQKTKIGKDRMTAGKKHLKDNNVKKVSEMKKEEILKHSDFSCK